ncbi:MAG TPA: tyrosine--tRNA ligase, partial [Alphaproteobacteria bacterium]|nr:tyrosine--tRNA ligase [Alphaproteobacteria bacterium]
MDFIHLAKERGYFHQCTNEEGLKQAFSSKQVVGYIGFDATADSLHVGSLVQIMMLRLLQRCGHKPLVLMGGGTSRVGDPSFKDEARKLLALETIEANIQGIKKAFLPFIDFNNAEFVNNEEWLCHLNYMDFLRDYGRHFTINRMLSFDSVKLRLEREQPLSFLEFNYMILQGYDFLELNKRYGCVLQMGGSDQWGNIVNGIELTRKVLSKEVFGLTSPLITTSGGAKMGKTAQGAVWLNKERLSSFDYWQFWRNTDDADVGPYLRLFTELPLEEIKKLEALKDSETNEAKKVLANEATTLLHGKEGLLSIHERISSLFEGKTGDLTTLER